MQTSSTVTTGIDPAALLTPPPETIGRFAVVGEIGRGANGVVYAAHDPVLGRDVAIKAIPLTVNNKARERAEASFIKEARAVASLNHPHIVTVFDAGRTDTVATSPWSGCTAATCTSTFTAARGSACARRRR